MPKTLPKCSVCGAPTNGSVNDVPFCYDCYQAGFVPAAAKPKPKKKAKATRKPKVKKT